MSRILFDRVNGVDTELYCAPSDGKRFNDDKWVRRQHVAPYIEQNKRRQNDGHGWNKARDMHHVASIPLVVLEHWLNEAGISQRDYLAKPKAYKDLIRRKINDPDWRWVRASELKAAPVKRKATAAKGMGSTSITDAVRSDQAA